MKVATKRGDTGHTDIFSKRIKKCDEVIEVLGQIDECIALIVAYQANYNDSRIHHLIEHFSCIAAIISGYIKDDQFQLDWIRTMEQEVLQMEEKNGDFKFVYPIHHPQSASLNVLRTHIRKLERTCWKLNESQTVSSDILSYINRSSDFIFLLSIV